MGDILAHLKMHWCLYWHRAPLEVVEDLSSVAKRVRCSKCKSEYAVNRHEQAILPWTQEFADFYKMMRELDTRDV